MIKAVLFDADGIIIKAPKMFSQTLAWEYGVSSEKSLPFFHGVFQKCLVGEADLKVEIRPYLESWGVNKNVDDFLSMWFQSENYPDVSMINFVIELKKNGLRCYLATNQEKYRTQYMQDQMGLGKVFDDIYSSADVGFRKPHKDFFLALLHEIKLKSDEVLFTDDSEVNVRAAQLLGIKSHLFKNMRDFKVFLEENTLCE